MEKLQANHTIPLISVIIPTWNNDATLPTTLAALAQQTSHDFEVIIVDNGSASFDALEIQRNWQTLHLSILTLPYNSGFTHACNVGAQNAKGEWLAFLNADAFPHADWLEQFQRHYQQYPGNVASFCSLITQANQPDLIDDCGDVYNFSGNAWKRLAGYPLHFAPQKAERVFSANAAAAFYRRHIFLELGGFDGDFFSYFEDVDLGFRLNLAGYQCFYLPSLRVEHVGSASVGRDSDFAIYHHHRNLTWTYWKNMPAGLFYLYLPLLAIGEGIFFLKYLFRGRGKIICKAKIDAFKAIGKTLKKRHLIQSKRRISACQLNRLLNKQFFAPYLLGYSRRRFYRKHANKND